MERHLAWPDCVNACDLGGLPTTDGRCTRAAAVVRSDSLDRLTDARWRALDAHGIRTIVDLRNDVEREAEPYACATAVVHVPIEDDTDRDFVDRWRPFSTPHYYAAALARWPDRAAAVVRAIARAQPGGADLATERRRRARMGDRDVLVGLLSSFDAVSYLRGAGVDEVDLAALRTRLVDGA